MIERELAATAAAMVAPGKGILAIDESGGTIKKRFDSIGVESKVETRRAYRDLLITADGLSQFISGMILYDETIRQAAKDGTPFVEVLRKNGILAGIKVDAGAKDLAGAPGEPRDLCNIDSDAWWPSKGRIGGRVGRERSAPGSG